MIKKSERFMVMNTNIIIMGPPGSGKGTQSELIVSSQGYQHLATGDIIRENIMDHTPLGIKCIEYNDKGILVPDDLVIEIVEKYYVALNANVIWDGFPRTIIQAEKLDKMLHHHGEKINKVFLLKLDEKQLLHRIAGRLTCDNCGHTFHITMSPPKVSNICDYCHHKLVSRSDDNAEKFKIRLNTYYKWADKLIKYYQDQNILIQIAADQPSEEITKIIRQGIHG